MKYLLLLGLAVALLSSFGCGKSSGEVQGYSKKDFAKTPPPAGYMGNIPKGPPGPAGK